MDNCITLAHGNGGKLTHRIINDLFIDAFHNSILACEADAAILKLEGANLAFTTDSFVVTPIFFKGGDIGKLAVCGTVNDLAAVGAFPRYMSCGFIIEEGFSLDNLKQIVTSMKDITNQYGIKIVAGDTKVVPKGAADKIFINTSGIGTVASNVKIDPTMAMPGDDVIITGTIGDHGCCILLERSQLSINAEITSDCAPLADLIQNLLCITNEIHVMRDPSRGGVATALNEIAMKSNVGIKIFERMLPIKDEVRGVCEILGLDPLYMANEGKMIIIVPQYKSAEILNCIKSNKFGKDASIVGHITDEHAGNVVMETVSGGGRIVDMLTTDQLPRIC